MLSPNNFSRIELKLLGSAIPNNDAFVSTPAIVVPPDAMPEKVVSADYVDSSFSGQFRQIQNNPSWLEPGLIKPPDAYVFTAFSAIPLAQAVRSYMETLNQAAPPMTHIEANWKNSLAYFNPDQADYPTSYPLNLPPITDYPPAQAELERLGDVVGGAEHVCLVEQYVSSGRTLAFASRILYAAGVRTVSAIRGNWYSELPERERPGVNMETLAMRSVGITGFMSHIGHSMARQSQRRDREGRATNASC